MNSSNQAIAVESSIRSKKVYYCALLFVTILSYDILTQWVGLVATCGSLLPNSFFPCCQDQACKISLKFVRVRFWRMNYWRRLFRRYIFLVPTMYFLQM